MMGSNLSGKRVFITGISGFIGANLAHELLKQRVEVHGLIRPTSNLWRLENIWGDMAHHQANLLDRSSVVGLVKQIQPDIIFHFAVYRHQQQVPDSLSYLDANTIATRNLLDAASQIDLQRFVYISSSSEYGSRSRPLVETDALMPGSFHGASKAASTILVQTYAHTQQLSAVILRVFLAYGIWEAPHKFISTAIRSAFQGLPLHLTEHEYRRDYVYSADVITACLKAVQMDSISGEIFNIGSGQQRTNREVVAAIEEITGRAINIHPEPFPPRSWDTDNWVADIQKARKILGWSPQYDFSVGLHKTIQWWQEYYTSKRED